MGRLGMDKGLLQIVLREVGARGGWGLLGALGPVAAPGSTPAWEHFGRGEGFSSDLPKASASLNRLTFPPCPILPEMVGCSYPNARFGPPNGYIGNPCLYIAALCRGGGSGRRWVFGGRNPKQKICTALTMVPYWGGWLSKDASFSSGRAWVLVGARFSSFWGPRGGGRFGCVLGLLLACPRPYVPERRRVALFAAWQSVCPHLGPSKKAYGSTWGHTVRNGATALCFAAFKPQTRV